VTTVKSYPATSQGRRKNNEDSFSYLEPGNPDQLKGHGCLYVVADGVGGAAKGEQASLYAAEKAVDEYYQSAGEGIAYLPEPLGDLSAILRRINEEIYDFAAERGTRMATTIVAAVTRGEYLYLVNVGDSRAYLIRNNIAEQLTHDHSLVGEMVQHGEMTEAEAMASKIKNRLTRSLGGDPEVTVGTYGPYKMQNGDKILLCSDGLTRYATIQDITAMTAMGTPKEIAERLVKFADDCGGADNTTVILISYQPDDMEDTVVPTAPRMPTVHLLEDKTADPVSADIPARMDKKTLSYLAMAMAALVVIAGVGVTILLGGRSPKPIAPVALILPITTISPSPELPLPTATMTFTPAPTASLPVVNAPVTGEPAESMYVCAIDIQAGDTFDNIVTKYQLSETPPYEYCILDVVTNQCSKPLKIESTGTIFPEWSLIIPGVTAETDCQIYNGKWAPIAPLQ